MKKRQEKAIKALCMYLKGQTYKEISSTINCSVFYVYELIKIGKRIAIKMEKTK